MALRRRCHNQDCLFGPQYTRIDGLSSNNASIVNEFGQVAGFTRRYAGTTISSPVGQDAWYYDYASGQTFGITFSVRSSDSYAYSEISYVGDDGLAVGRYNSYDLLGNFLGTRAFLFSMSMGLQDLGQLVDGGLSANGWASLASAYRSSGGHIMGNGNLLSQPLGSTSFVASQSVPEPTLVWIFPLLFSGFVLARFRKGKKGCQLPIA